MEEQGRLEDEALQVGGEAAAAAPLLAERVAYEGAAVVDLSRAWLEVKSLGPYGVVLVNGRWRVQGYGDLRRFLPRVWKLPVFAERFLDAFDVYARMSSTLFGRCRRE